MFVYPFMADLDGMIFKQPSRNLLGVPICTYRVKYFAHPAFISSGNKRRVSQNKISLFIGELTTEYLFSMELTKGI